MRSRWMRRISVWGDAVEECLRPASLRRFRMKASIGCLAMEGGSLFSGLLKAQCDSYFPPCWIHFSSSFFSASERIFLDFGGGICSSSSSDWVRKTRSLKSGFPGTMAMDPSRSAYAFSAMSRRRSALRASLSGPWHSKQLFDRIGKISRL